MRLEEAVGDVCATTLYMNHGYAARLDFTCFSSLSYLYLQLDSSLASWKGRCGSLNLRLHLSGRLFAFATPPTPTYLYYTVHSAVLFDDLMFEPGLRAARYVAGAFSPSAQQLLHCDVTHNQMRVASRSSPTCACAAYTRILSPH